MGRNDGELICPSAALAEGGAGVRFEVTGQGRALAAFVVRHDGRVYAYVNRCAHRGVELDWEPGQFFDRAGRYLICATHGALYEPKNGGCVGGPCGGGLVKLPVIEKNNGVYLLAADADGEGRSEKQ